MEVAEIYAVYGCACGSKDLKLIDGPFTDPRIHCNKCGAWAIGDTRQDVVKEWNRCVEMELDQALGKPKITYTHHDPGCQKGDACECEKGVE